MSRPARFAFVALASLILVGCKTSEIKNQTDWPAPGLSEGVPTGSVKSGYGDGHGDSVGGGGAGPALDSDSHYTKTEEPK